MAMGATTETNADNTEPSTFVRTITKACSTMNAENENGVNNLSSSSSSSSTSTFDHVFSGFSLWLELETTPQLQELMRSLAEQCGGTDCGVHGDFVPHITLQYNLSTTSTKISVDDHHLDATLTVDGKQQQQHLDEFWNAFLSQQQEKNRQRPGSPHESSSIAASLQYSNSSATPYEWYYHHYPKHADNGKGFGAAIALLLIQKEPWMQDLYDYCQHYWGVGERTTFVPHVSVVYAPLDKAVFLQHFVKNQQNKGDKCLLQEPFKLRYLSLWNTIGRIQEWKRVARISL